MKHLTVSFTFHFMIIAIYIAIINFLNYEKTTTFNISLNNSSSPYINMIQTPNTPIPPRKHLNLKEQKFNSHHHINTKEKKIHNKKKEKQQPITKQSLTSGGESFDENTAKTVIQDQSLLDYKTPTYPRRAIQQKQQGVVIVRMLVNEIGEIKKVIIKKSSGYQALDNSVLQTVRYWETKRTLSEPSWIEVKIKFAIQG